MTLTVDPKRFESAEAAYKFVSEGRYVSRLMKELKVTRWVKALEFQMKHYAEWGGQPHWHVLIDSAYATGWVDLERAWQLWRDTWGIGGVDLTLKEKLRGRSVEHVVRYICKYLVKFPEKGFPSWVLARRNVRFIEASRSVGALVNAMLEPLEQCDAIEKVEQKVLSQSTGEAAKKRKKSREWSIGERVARCCESSVLLTDDGRGGEAFGSSVRVRSGQIAIAGKLGLLAGVEFVAQVNEYGRSVMEVYVRALPGESIEAMAYRIEQGVGLLKVEAAKRQDVSPHHETGGNIESGVAAFGCASVPAVLALWREQIRRGKLFISEGDAEEGAVAEPTDAYLRELIAEESREVGLLALGSVVP